MKRILNILTAVICLVLTAGCGMMVGVVLGMADAGMVNPAKAAAGAAFFACLAVCALAVCRSAVEAANK